MMNCVFLPCSTEIKRKGERQTFVWPLTGRQPFSNAASVFVERCR